MPPIVLHCAGKEIALSRLMRTTKEKSTTKEMGISHFSLRWSQSSEPSWLSTEWSSVYGRPRKNGIDRPNPPCGLA